MLDRDGQDLLRAILADDVLVQDGLDLHRLGQRPAGGERILAIDFFRDDVVAEPDALVADVNGWACDQLLHFLLRLPAKGTLKIAVTIFLATVDQCCAP
jgi:hypothetical protein